MRLVDLGGSPPRAIIEGAPEEIRSLATLFLLDVEVVAVGAVEAVQALGVLAGQLGGRSKPRPKLRG